MPKFKLIAMLPARLGSKRVPQKNIRYLCGKPLIQYAIDIAKQANCFDEVWVNSESELLGRLARQSNINFHHRPSVLASDTATNQDFTYEFLQRHYCEYVIMLNPTSPLLRPETVQSFCSFVQDYAFDTVLSVLEEKAECFFSGQAINFSKDKKTNSQELEPIQKVVWSLTAWRRAHFLELAKRGECPIFAGKVGLFPIPHTEACDIDTQEDWNLAEAMLVSQSPEKLNYLMQSQSPTYWGQEHENG